MRTVSQIRIASLRVQDTKITLPFFPLSLIAKLSLGKTMLYTNPELCKTILS